MKTYPSIPRSTGQSFQEFDAYVFDKKDGSNLRFEWSRKRHKAGEMAWKYGTRQRLFDETDPLFSQAIPVFHSTLAEQLIKVAFDERWDSFTAFAEFYGPNSFAGWHDAADPKTLTLFDVSVHKKGLLGPREFLKLFEGPNTAPFLGHQKWTRGFVDLVYQGQIPGVTFEGVVGKGGSGHELVMAKAKTQAWLDKVKEKLGDKAEEILNS
jgi:hypothetical protein